MPGNLQLPAATHTAELTRRMSDLGAEADARQLLVTGSAGLFGCAAAGFGQVTVSSSRREPVVPERLDFTFGGDGTVAAGLTELTRAAPEAVALAALRQDEPVHSDDLAQDGRWPGYAEAMARWAGMRSVLAVPVRLTGTALGVLVLYAGEPGLFDAETAALAGTLADQAALALGLLAGRTKNRNLTIALETSREIGQAMGILMATRKVTGDRAFDLLKQASQQAHVKLRELAREVILTGQLPAG
ncbi:MAG TPA: GAF and ANTAR domain-containing protein [Jatrophihabitans sp.]|nr:GAF and ANTAR domain-containing protein [Jatrophihabitans sp.]